MLPVLKDIHAANVWRMLRLWAIVLVANLAGTLFAAVFCRFTPVLSAGLMDSMLAISRDLKSLGWWEMSFRGIASGFLIAAMVWMIPSAESAKFAVITADDLSDRHRRLHPHRRRQHGGQSAGAVGRLGMVAHAWQFFVPALIGNVIGGTALFALISYAQVMEEI